MEDEQIIDLYFRRSEQAISETDHKYGRPCRKVSLNILRNREDTEECVNDTYLTAWNTIPPKRPDPFVAFLLRIVKNLSLKKYRDSSVRKRNSGLDVCFEELEECLPSGNGADMTERAHLKMLIEQFLDRLGRDDRIMFVRRYWYGDSVKDIAKALHITQNNASVQLHRLRKELKTSLEKKGVIV